MTERTERDARRVTLTALSVVAFSVLAHRGYWMGYDEVVGHYGWAHRYHDFLGPQLVTPVLLAVVPGLLLNASVQNSPVPVRPRWVRVAIVLYVIAIAFCYDLGEGEAWRWADGDGGVPPDETPWGWILTVITSTVAVVLFLARRDSVRAAPEPIGAGRKGAS